MEHRAERTILTLILILFAILGITYSIVVPPFEASDELWHYPMVKYVVDHWALPVQKPGVEAPWRQEGSQPPLYYGLAAAATFWIDTSDMEVVRHLNPHVDNGVATADGNINLVVHHPAREAFPWHGTVLAVHLIRFLSVLMGVVAVYLTYLIAREVLPDQPGLTLGAAAVHAFTPMYVFISGSVNNDNLVVPLSSLALLMLLKMINARFQARNVKSLAAFYLPLGIVLGLAALTKASSLALTGLAALVVIVRALRRRSRRPEPVEGWTEFFVGGLTTLLPLLVIAGWWYLRNLQLYGDISGLNVFTEILGTREVPADLAQLWRERYSFAAGYWGNFGGLNVPMSAWAYSVLNTLVVVAALGLLVLLFRQMVGSRQRLFIVHCSLFIVLSWGLGVVIPWSQWASTTWSSQGRLVFTALPVWSLLLVMGLAGWSPRRWQPWLVATLALFLFGLTMMAPFVWIKPAYVLPDPLTDDQVTAIPYQLAADFGTMRLLGYDLETEEVAPGGQVGVTLYWEALAPTDRDYAVFVHLLGEGELIVAQRDTFPGLGRLSTTWLEPGFRWADRYVLQVPDTTYTPDTAQIQAGLYDPTTGVRLLATAPDAKLLGNSGDNVRFGQVQVRTQPGGASLPMGGTEGGNIPNPISVNFGDRMALIGYDLDRRIVRPGETITLTLHWQCLQQMDVNYNISAQFIDAGQRKAAQRDSWPLDGAAPTAAWEPGQILTDEYTMTIYPDTLPGVYDVRVVVYALEEEGQIVHLPTVPADGQMQANHITLTTMRVVP